MVCAASKGSDQPVHTPADDSNETSCPIKLFLKKQHNLKLSSLKIIGGALWVDIDDWFQASSRVSLIL